MAECPGRAWSPAVSGRAEQIDDRAVVHQDGGDQIKSVRGEAVDPGPRISISLRAVARPARGYDVARDTLAARGDWDDVIESCGGPAAAVRAQPLRGLVQKLSGLCPHGSNPAPARCTAPPTTAAGGGRVAFPRFGVCVLSAQPTLDCVARQPGRAAAAPRKPSLRGFLALRFAGPPVVARAVAEAGRPQSVTPRPVAGELGLAPPFLALRAPLLAELPAGDVLRQINTDSPSRRGGRTCFRAHHRIVAVAPDTRTDGHG